MFNGIIQATGFIYEIESDKIYIKTNLDLSDCKIGSSISCNGVCLTATSIKKLQDNEFIFSVNISEETKNRTNFSRDLINKIINIEKSLKFGDEISGHFVYGHVDCITQILNIQKLNSSWNFKFQKNDNMKKFIVEKGSISINGISLTIAGITTNSFFLSIIPHTYNSTNLKIAKVNDLVNIEFDALARYIIKND